MVCSAFHSIMLLSAGWCPEDRLARLWGLTVKRLQHATLSASLSRVWLSFYANHPWLVIEPEAVGMPGWQTGAKALCCIRLLCVFQWPVPTVLEL